MTADVSCPRPFPNAPQNAIIPTAEQPLYFLHIPKTAGTTLYNAMDDRFEVSHICPDRFLPQMLKRDPTSLKAFRFFRGHFGYSLKNFVDRPLTYVTVLRDPVDRCISQYEDVRRVSNNFLYQRVNEHRMTFADFARDSETQIAINNLQARNLAFDWMPEQMDNFNLIRRGIAGTSLGIPDDELLDIARERLRQCGVVGVVERFQDTLNLLAYRFCWYPITTPRRLNQSARRLRQDTLDAATLDAVREKNQVDEALYRYAVELFESQFNQMAADLAPAAPDPQFSIRPALLQRYGEAVVHQSAFCAQVNFSMTHPVAGDHWYAREGLEEGCTPFRWTGPGTVSTVYVALKAEDRRLKTENRRQKAEEKAGVGGQQSLSLATHPPTDPPTHASVQKNSLQAMRVQVYVVRAIAPDILQSLSLQVNGAPVPLTVLTQWESTTILEGVIPATAISVPPALTALSLSVSRTESMQAIAPHTPDHRQVGVAVSRILLFPVGDAVPEQTGVRLFPDDDDLWSEVRVFVQSHVKPGEAIAAPKEFWQPFPAQFIDITRLSLEAGEPRMPEWAIVAKHLTQQIPSTTFQPMVATLRPVFANQVFVILSSRTDLPTVPYFSDAPWGEAADFLAKWLKPGERLVAPKEFLFRLPEAEFLGDLRGEGRREEGGGHRTKEERTRQTADRRPQTAEWVVVYKGHLAECSDADLEALVTELRPVFANLVFVIFSGRTEVRHVPFWNRDMRPFWKVYFRRRGLKAIQQIIQLP